MNGLLADVMLQGHLSWLRSRLESVDLWTFLVAEEIRLVTFADLGLHPRLDDRTLWRNCQAGGWVLFTYDKNKKGPNSLQTTLDDSWMVGNLPVLTLANQGKFVRGGEYSNRVAEDIADSLVRIRLGELRDRPRIFVPA